jgi:hypothetical protein
MSSRTMGDSACHSRFRGNDNSGYGVSIGGSTHQVGIDPVLNSIYEERIMRFFAQRPKVA